MVSWRPQCLWWTSSWMTRNILVNQLTSGPNFVGQLRRLCWFEKIPVVDVELHPHNLIHFVGLNPQFVWWTQGSVAKTKILSCIRFGNHGKKSQEWWIYPWKSKKSSIISDKSKARNLTLHPDHFCCLTYWLERFKTVLKPLFRCSLSSKSA